MTAAAGDPTDRGGSGRGGRTPSRRLCAFTCLAIAAVQTPSHATAQAAADPAVSPAPQGATVDGKQVFTPADFARFAPKTAYDMLVQAPGFLIRLADQERGLGQASENVL